MSHALPRAGRSRYRAGHPSPIDIPGERHDHLFPSPPAPRLGRLHAADSRRGSSRRTDHANRLAQRRYYALYPRSRHVPLKLRAFIDFISARYAEEPATSAAG
ncbi:MULTISPECIES: hypothetical protein [Burkholderia]|uniref:hypothetical protein n=1 Tax=Burkholderia TaxID=32008 RepID=UPI001645255E|nr:MULTISPECIES: hypothetical protein [Burkholderia]MDN7739850.1 hypothetical protein [Burkholderia gladioli]